MKIKKKVFLLLMTLNWSSGCVPPQHRLDFDLTQNAVVSCDERIKIKQVSIKEKEGGPLYWIDLLDGDTGNNILFLDRPNQGYTCNSNYPLEFKPNGVYVLSSVNMDSSLEMIFYTDESGKIDSVSNPLPCLEYQD